MKQMVLANLNSPLLPIIGLLLFIGLFTGMIFWINRKDSNKIYKKMENLPLSEDGRINGGHQ